MNLSATTDFPSMNLEYISKILFCEHDFNNLSYILLPLSTHVLYVLHLDSSKIFWKVSSNSVIKMNFLSFKEKTQLYLLKISIEYNKKRFLY